MAPAHIAAAVDPGGECIGELGEYAFAIKIVAPGWYRPRPCSAAVHAALPALVTA
jgi:hypothetical protein